MSASDKKTKVLFIITKSNWGGASTLGRLLRDPRSLTASPVSLHGETSVSPTPFLAPPQLS
jgi:hypothetical protein